MQRSRGGVAIEGSAGALSVSCENNKRVFFEMRRFADEMTRMPTSCFVEQPRDSLSREHHFYLQDNVQVLPQHAPSVAKQVDPAPDDVSDKTPSITSTSKTTTNAVSHPEEVGSTSAAITPSPRISSSSIDSVNEASDAGHPISEEPEVNQETKTETNESETESESQTPMGLLLWAATALKPEPEPLNDAQCDQAPLYHNNEFVSLSSPSRPNAQQATQRQDYEMSNHKVYVGGFERRSITPQPQLSYPPPLETTIINGTQYFLSEYDTGFASSSELGSSSISVPYRDAMLCPSGASLTSKLNDTNRKGKKRQRMSRCGQCHTCTLQDCGECSHCRDMPKFGGPGKMKQCCSRRGKCLRNNAISQSMSTYTDGPLVLSLDGTPIDEEDNTLLVPKKQGGPGGRKRSPMNGSPRKHKVADCCTSSSVDSKSKKHRHNSSASESDIFDMSNSSPSLENEYKENKCKSRVKNCHSETNGRKVGRSRSPVLSAEKKSKTSDNDLPGNGEEEDADDCESKSFTSCKSRESIEKEDEDISQDENDCSSSSVVISTGRRRKPTYKAAMMDDDTSKKRERSKSPKTSKPKQKPRAKKPKTVKCPVAIKQSTDPMFVVNDKVYAADNEILYVSKILAVRTSKENTFQYKIHYLGYKKRYDCWMDEYMLLASEEAEEFIAVEGVAETVRDDEGDDDESFEVISKSPSKSRTKAQRGAGKPGRKPKQRGRKKSSNKKDSDIVDHEESSPEVVDSTSVNGDDLVPQFVRNDDVYAQHKQILYEAKVINSRCSKGNLQYRVHYQGFKKSSDCWLDQSLVYAIDYKSKRLYRDLRKGTR